MLKQHRSDLALQEHLDGAAVEELYLTVVEVLRRDAFFTELRYRVFGLGNLHNLDRKTPS